MIWDYLIVTFHIAGTSHKIHHKPHVSFLHWRPGKARSTGTPQDPLFYFIFLFKCTHLPPLSCNLIITSCCNWIAHPKALKKSNPQSIKRAHKLPYKVHYMFEKEQRGNEQSPGFIIHAEKMKIETETIRVSKRKLMGKGMGALLKEGRGRFYILRRCIIMLLCSHD